MKKSLLFVLMSMSLLICSAQKTKLTWSEEFTLSSGSTGIKVMHVDKSGIYIEEWHTSIKNFYFLLATLKKSATLVKFDKNLVEQYHNDYNVELKGKNFEKFFFLSDKLFLLAMEYDKGKRRLALLQQK